MQKLIAELNRLYLPAGALSAEVLAQRAQGVSSAAIGLVDADGRARALVIPFRKQPGRDGAQHWTLLCEVANAMQTQLGLPAPAVSISGADGYGLWLSFATPVATAQLQQLFDLLRSAYFPDGDARPDAATAAVELPPCLHARTGLWAAFIHPGLGASFADESGLDMAPPAAGQVALLEHLDSISDKQLLHAMTTLRQSQGMVPSPAPAPPAPSAVRAGLLLQDATLEDIVRHLHAKNIEPTFRHLIPETTSSGS
jgi:hypothetical protein